MNTPDEVQDTITKATAPLSRHLCLEAERSGITYEVLIIEPKTVLLADVPDAPAVLLYVVDAPVHGALVAAIARNLSLWLPDPQNIQPVTVVAIGPPINTAAEFAGYLDSGRRRDLVPKGDPAGDDHSAAGDFLEFIHRQVDPEVRRRTRTLNQKAMLFGHGLSGLFACHAFATQHPMFDRYIILSPTLMDDSPTRVAMKQAPKGQIRGHLYLSISEEDRLDGPDPRHNGAIGRSFHQLAALAGPDHRPHLHAKVDVWKGESAQSQIPAALISALRWHLPSTGVQGFRMIFRHFRAYIQITVGMISNAIRARRELKRRTEA